LAGALVGIIIRYGLDAQKHPYIMDCWYNKSAPQESLPSSVVIKFNNSHYYEYSNGKRVVSDVAAQPQFEDKVVDGHFSGGFKVDMCGAWHLHACVCVLFIRCICDVIGSCADTVF